MPQAAPVSQVLVGVGKVGGLVELVLHWVLFRLNSPDEVSTKYDLGAGVGPTIYPGVLSASSDTHTSIPSSRSGHGRTRWILSLYHFCFSLNALFLC